ncbi:MAG TPA: hypothetical protein PLY05_04190 [Agitococcus sp.]|nr:hypothetical protein [Agitococcus sp.]
MSWLSKGLKSLEGAVASVIPHQTAAERRMKSDMISAYYSQKENAMAEQQRIGAEKQAQQRRIQEKTIRAMRRQYRSSGFMQPMTDASGMQSKLG